MAVLKQSTGGGGMNLGQPPPAGTHIAVCVKIVDQFEVDPLSIGWQQESQKGVKAVDVTRFVFGILGPDNRTYYVGTRLLRISGNEKSGLYKLLTTWTGKPPAYGRDYAVTQQQDPEVGCLGRPGMISVTLTQKGDKTYADVAAVMPVPQGVPVPQVAPFVEQLTPGNVVQQRTAPAPQAAPPAAQTPPPGWAPPATPASTAPAWGGQPPAAPAPAARPAPAAAGWGVGSQTPDPNAGVPF